MARLRMIEDDVGIIQQEDDYHLQVKFREDKTNVDPTICQAVITYPCSSGTASMSMATTSTTGLLEGHFDVPSSATYGEYRVKIEATYDAQTYQFETFFYVLPWNIIQQVRSLSGIKQSNDVEDKDLALICWNSYLEAKEEVFQLVINEKIHQDSNHCIDGSNKVFYACNRHIVSDHTVCDEDSIYGYYKDTDYEWQDLTISITDAEKGKLSIADKNGDALSGNLCCNIIYSYRIQSRAFKEQMFKKAVAYLSAHEAILRFNELDKVTLADVNSNEKIILANPNRMYNKYKKTLKKISKIKVGGV